MRRAKAPPSRLSHSGSIRAASSCIRSPRRAPTRQQRPWLWRFWLKVPNRGEMVIFDHSWYGRVLEERVERTIPEKAWRQAYRDIVEFERMLADDGTTILKFFLHISKKEQRRRFESIEAIRWRHGG